MSIDFKIRDFAYPISILKLRSFLEKSQWFPDNRLREYQLKRLRLVLKHAYKQVPYYKDLFGRLKLRPEDFKTMQDIRKIPILTKERLRKNFSRLIAKNEKRFKPILYRTSGTSGEPVEFYLDKYANVLEFCYYWRHWSWAGYRLGMPFAEFSLHHFLNEDIKGLAHYSFCTNRLILNPAQISYENIDKLVKEIKKYRPLFFKGSPSTIYIFSLLLEGKGYNTPPLKAVFTTGELLLSYQKEKIEKILNCKILDSYGHMERTVAISMCASGNYHVNSEYGILEVEENKDMSSEEKIIGHIIGTSLHNFAMPLVRYKIEDLIEIDSRNYKCGCGRGLPIIKKISGRQQDIIVTKEGKFITNIFILFYSWKGLLWFQFIQEDIDKFKLVLVKSPDFEIESVAEKIKVLKSVLGKNVIIDLEFLKLEDINFRDIKYRPVISQIEIGRYIKKWERSSLVY